MQNAARELQATLVTFTPPIDSSSEQRLEAQVRDFVVRAKSLGLPPEKVVISLKDLVQEVLPVGARHWYDAPDARDAMVEKMVRWSIEQYFER